MKDINLFGAGGHCYAALELIKSIGSYVPKRIFDDNSSVDQILGVQVSTYEPQMDDDALFCISIGDNAVRKKIANLLDKNFPTLIHASAVVYPSVTIGRGSQILPNAVIDAAVSLGDFCIVNNNATVSHNVVVGNFVHIAINAAVAGRVQIGEGTLVGAGSVINPEIKIGNWVTIGAGAIVTKDVPNNAVVYGNPARIIRYNE